jgi:hypothetical protein
MGYKESLLIAAYERVQCGEFGMVILVRIQLEALTLV